MSDRLTPFQVVATRDHDDYPMSYRTQRVSDVVQWLVDEGYLDTEERQLYEGWGRDKRSKGLHRRYVTEWEPVDE